MLKNIKQDKQEEKINLVTSEYEAYKRWGLAASPSAKIPSVKSLSKTKSERPEKVKK